MIKRLDSIHVCKIRKMHVQLNKTIYIPASENVYTAKRLNNIYLYKIQKMYVQVND